MKKVMGVLAVVLSVVLCLAGCNGEKTANEADIDTLMNNMLDAMGEEAQVYEDIPEDIYETVYGVVKSEYEDVLIKGTMTNIRANEIILIKTVDEEQMEKAVETLNTHLASLNEVWSNYSPDQYEKVKNAVVESKGSYAVLIVSQEPQKVLDAFDSTLD